MRRSDARTAYWMFLPAVVIEVALVFVPLIIGAWYSLHKVRYFQIKGFVGLDNYASVLSSGAVLNSLLVTAVFSFAALFFTFFLGFALALWLQKDSATNTAMRAIVLIPYMIAMLVGSMLLKWIYARESGISPMILGAFGMGDVSILADPQLAMGGLVFNAMWRDSAFAMIMLLAGLKSVPTQVFDAARVDGAGKLYIFRRIVLPLLRIPILITVIRLFIHFVNTLTFPLILTGGGPANSTDTLVLRMFRMGFQDHILGKANALAIMIFLGNMVLVSVLLLLFRKAQKI